MLSGAGSAAAGFTLGFLLMRRAGQLRAAAFVAAASALFALEAGLLAGARAGAALGIGAAAGLAIRGGLDAALAAWARREANS